MMSLWDALRMNMMISYQELVRTFLSFVGNEERNIEFLAVSTVRPCTNNTRSQSKVFNFTINETAFSIAAGSVDHVTPEATSFILQDRHYIGFVAVLVSDSIYFALVWFNHCFQSSFLTL
ncbi:hypothetical protein EA184_24060 [Escherichia coli]|nr:hypothetical protein EA184_24060 [Escherichia coli]